MTSALLRFRVSTGGLHSSFGAPTWPAMRIGTKGDVRSSKLTIRLRWIAVTVKGKSRKKTFRKRDQFAPELDYFSNCILNDKTPEPSGREGVADVRIIEALYRSAKRGRPMKIEPLRQAQRPSMKQTKYRPAVDKPALVHAEGAAL